MNELVYSGELVVVSCWCGMRHAVPEELRAFQLRQHRDGRDVTSIYCPLGHGHMPAGKGQAQIERERRQQAEARASAIKDQLQATERSLTATKGQLTKARKRAANGVCPCCKRSFVNVQRHMATKHPNEVAS